MRGIVRKFRKRVVSVPCPRPERLRGFPPAVGSDSPNQQVTFVLECVECGQRSDEGRGWRAYLDEDECDVWVYCAECARREFGDA